VFKNLENEYKIGGERRDCEKYHWMDGFANFYPNLEFQSTLSGAVNRRRFEPTQAVVLGPPLGAGDFPFEFDDTFDIGKEFDAENYTVDEYNSILFPLDGLALRVAHGFISSAGGTGSQATIRRLNSFRTSRWSHMRAFKCAVEIFSVRYFDPLTNSSFISFVTANEKLCDICANPTDTNLDFRIVLDEPSITFRNEPFSPSSNVQTADIETINFGELDQHDSDFTITEVRKFFFMEEPVTQATLDAANFNNEDPTLWDDPSSIQPGLVPAPAPGGSLTAYGFLYTLEYIIAGTDTIIGRLNDPPTQQTATVQILEEFEPPRLFRTEIEDTFIYDEDRADRLWNTQNSI